MLDVFIICIILVLTNKQFLIGGTAEIGVIFFLLAILLSMSASYLIEKLLEKTNFSTHRQKKILEKLDLLSGKKRILIVAGLFLSIITLIIAIGAPYIQITEFILSNNSYSIIDTFLSLLKHSVILSIFAFLTLIFFPIVNIALCICFWSINFKDRNKYIKIHRWIEVLSKLDMLDVFMFSLILFMIEGRWLIKTSLKGGLTLLLIFIIITYFIPLIIKVLQFLPSYLYAKYTQKIEGAFNDKTNNN
jgi:uncharacterized paraquat-inducible protein A